MPSQITNRSNTTITASLRNCGGALVAKLFTMYPYLQQLLAAARANIYYIEPTTTPKAPKKARSAAIPKQITVTVSKPNVMTGKEIQSVLKVPNFVNYRDHASRLAKVMTFLQGVQGDIVSAELVADNVEMGFGATYEMKPTGYNFERERVEVLSGMKMPFAKLAITTKTGNYAFAIPNGNSFYYAVCDIIGIKYEVLESAEEKPIDTVTISAKALPSLAKAAKFVSQDMLRSSMTAVCLDMEKGKLQVVATDAHRLYTSEKTDCSQTERLQILISAKDAIKLAAIKTAEDQVQIHILTGDKISVLGMVISLVDTFGAKYVDYRCVVPEYSTFMVFDKKQFINNVKQVIPTANRSTSQINFHLNGSIAMTTQDIDFAYEAGNEMPYITKTFEDVDIAFNGKMLLECLSIFKEKEVSLYSDGKAKKAAILSNGIDNVLIMPLMIG